MYARGPLVVLYDIEGTVVKSQLRTHVSFDENIGALHYILALLELVCVPLSSAPENAAWKYFP
jgi:hypothetical protein